MELVSKSIPVSTRQSDEVLLMPVGDIQYSGDDKAIALGMLKRHVQWGVDHNAYFIGMGDYLDTFSPSNRERLANANLYDTGKGAVDKMAHDLVNELYTKALAPSKGRWLGLLEGHHYHEFKDSTTTDQELADLLGAPALGTSAYARLRFVRPGERGRANDVLIWAHHGTGGGSSISAPINKLAPMIQGFKADIYIMGHFTSKDGKPIDYVEPVYPKGNSSGKPQLIYRTKILACTGGFMKSYRAQAREGAAPRGNYAEQKMFRPASLGGVLIKIRPRWAQQNGVEVWKPDLGIEL